MGDDHMIVRINVFSAPCFAGVPPHDVCAVFRIQTREKALYGLVPLLSRNRLSRGKADMMECNGCPAAIAKRFHANSEGSRPPIPR